MSQVSIGAPLAPTGSNWSAWYQSESLIVNPGTTRTVTLDFSIIAGFPASFNNGGSTGMSPFTVEIRYFNGTEFITESVPFAPSDIEQPHTITIREGSSTISIRANTGPGVALAQEIEVSNAQDIDFGLPNSEGLLELGGNDDYADWVDDILDNLGNPLEALRGGLPDWVQDALDDFGSSERIGTPLVLDLDGDGIELAALNGTGSVYWDIDLDGFAEATGWTTGGDGLLAIDTNEDGVINDHSELFGDQNGSSNGFTALAAYDSNTDGYITSADTQFTDLLVWVDGNADGYSQNTELHTLTTLGITSINLAYSNVNYAISGNQIKQESTFTINGNTRTIVDAWLAYDNANTVYTEDYTLDARTLFLPSLRGYGGLPDLHIAMSLDEDLLEMVQEIATEDAESILSDTIYLKNRLEDILLQWAGVEGVNPTSRGAYVDARHLEFLEKMFGHEWLNFMSNANPDNPQGLAIEKQFDHVFAQLSAHVLMQTDAKLIFDENAAYNIVTGNAENIDISYMWFSSEYSSLTNTNSTNDTYFYNDGDGNDVIYESGGADRLVFGSDIAVEDVRLWKTGNDLFLYVGASSILLYNQFYANYLVENLVWADGTVLDLSGGVTFTGTSSAETVEGTANGDTLQGLAGNDTLQAYQGNDTLIGGGGDDGLYGNTGDDTYLWTIGDGNDTIYEGGTGTDKIAFGAGIDVEDVRLWKNGQDLFLYVGASSIRIAEHFNSNLQYRIEGAEFADSTVVGLTSNLTFTGTSSAEAVEGTANADTLKGLAGNDTLQAYQGNDTLIGGAGDDGLYGHLGDDTYVWNTGDGNDTIYEGGTGNDKILFGAGIEVEDVRLWINGQDLILYVGGNSITVSSHFNSNLQYRVESAVFADSAVVNLASNLTFTGTSSAETVYGTANADTLYGLAGNDSLMANQGNDTLIGGTGDDGLYGSAGDDAYVWNSGDGNDTIYDSGSGTDKIVFGAGIDVEDVRFWKSGNALILYVGSETIYVDNHYNGTQYRLETAEFANSTTLDLVNNLSLTGTSAGENVDGSANADQLYGLGGNDYLYGYNGNDALYGGAGTDTLNGGGGVDTFAWKSADIDGSLDTISDFSKSAGEKIDVSDVLDVAGYDPLTDVLTNFLQITEGASSTTFWIDTTGTGTFNSTADFAVLTGVTDILAGGNGSTSTLTDLQNLISNGTLVA
jgi:Ca2+-binding RTX toxin-like protein